MWNSMIYACLFFLLFLLLERYEWIKESYILSIIFSIVLGIGLSFFPSTSILLFSLCQIVFYTCVLFFYIRLPFLSLYFSSLFVLIHRILICLLEFLIKPAGPSSFTLDLPVDMISFLIVLFMIMIIHNYHFLEVPYEHESKFLSIGLLLLTLLISGYIDLGIHHIYYYLLLFSMSFIMIGMMNHYIRLSHKNMKQELYTHIDELSLIYSHELLEDKNHIFKLQHDMKNHLIVIQKLLNHDDIENASIHIDTLLNGLKSHSLKLYTKIPIIDAYLSYISSQNDIEINIRINKDININNNDLLIVLMNLIDNALIHGDGDVRVNLLVEESIIIKVSNTLLHTPHINNKRYGLSIIKDIVYKYKGHYYTDYKHTTYNSYIEIKNG